MRRSSHTAIRWLTFAIDSPPCGAAFTSVNHIASRHDGWSAGLVGAATYVAIVAIAGYALPQFNEVPEHFSASVLWNFRIASLGLQAVLWTIVGLLFGFLAERVLAQPSRGRLYQARVPR